MVLHEGFLKWRVPVDISTKVDDWGVPLFQETRIWLYMSQYLQFTWNGYWIAEYLIVLDHIYEQHEVNIHEYPRLSYKKSSHNMIPIAISSGFAFFDPLMRFYIGYLDKRLCIAFPKLAKVFYLVHLIHLALFSPEWGT